MGLYLINLQTELLLHSYILFQALVLRFKLDNLQVHEVR